MDIRALLDDPSRPVHKIIACLSILLIPPVRYTQQPSYLYCITGYQWVWKILDGNPQRCHEIFRMHRENFILLCNQLQTNYGLGGTRETSVDEKVGIFLYIVAHCETNCMAADRFERSNSHVSISFHDVLRALRRMSGDLIKPSDPTFSQVPDAIRHDRRYMPFFQDCIGAIDGTHIHICVPVEKQTPFIGRKGTPTQNILAVCDFDLLFTFVLAGWEGTAHDSRVLGRALNEPRMNFPKPPDGRYYVVDAGFSTVPGFLGPYKGERYHLQDFRRGPAPIGCKEIFNRAHSSLRSAIERCFGVWKIRWKIVNDMPRFSVPTQVNVVLATMTLHNFIRLHSRNDYLFSMATSNVCDVPSDWNCCDLRRNASSSSQSYFSDQGNEMTIVRNEIALKLADSYGCRNNAIG